MSSLNEYRKHVLEQLSLIPEVSYRAMMGGYVIYYRGKVTGGIYDNDRILIKLTKSSRALLPDAPLELPYEGGKEMLRIENVDDLELIAELFDAMFDELPAPKPKKK